MISKLLLNVLLVAALVSGAGAQHDFLRGQKWISETGTYDDGQGNVKPYHLYCFPSFGTYTSAMELTIAEVASPVQVGSALLAFFVPRQPGVAI
jgi:hypothetical protein